MAMTRSSTNRTAASKWSFNPDGFSLSDAGGMLLFAAAATAGAGIGAALALRMARKQRAYFEDASVVITGGSRGLGLELARQFARHGARLTLLARDEDELRRAAQSLLAIGADVRVFPCDVRDPQQVHQ